jgi:hypothetical protein
MNEPVLYYVDTDTLEVESTTDYHKFDSSYHGSSTWEYSIKRSTGRIVISSYNVYRSELDAYLHLESMVKSKIRDIEQHIAGLNKRLPDLIVKEIVLSAKLIELTSGL